MHRMLGSGGLALAVRRGVPVAGHRGNGESTYLGTYVARMRKGRLPQCLVARLRDPCGYLRPRREAQLANDVLDVPFRRR